MLLEKKRKKKDLSSEDSSSDSGDNISFCNLAEQSKTEHFNSPSCSRTIGSDSESDESSPKANRHIESTEIGGNKGLSLMVIIRYLENVPLFFHSYSYLEKNWL